MEQTKRADELLMCSSFSPSGNRYNKRRESRRQDVSGFTRSPSRSPDFSGPQASQDVSMIQTTTYSMSHRVWTNANLAKEFVKVKTYSDLLVLRQDANDKLGEPARWVLHVSYFHKSSYPDVDKVRVD